MIARNDPNYRFSNYCTQVKARVNRAGTDRTRYHLAVSRRRGSDNIVIGRVRGPMAGNCFRQFWWWLPIAILSGWFPSRAADAGRITCTSVHPAEVVARGEQPPFGDADVVIFLGEGCHGEMNVTEIQDHLQRATDPTGKLTINVLPRSRECIVFSGCRLSFHPSVSTYTVDNGNGKASHTALYLASFKYTVLRRKAVIYTILCDGIENYF